MTTQDEKGRRPETPPKPPAERVESLFGQLEALEHAMAKAEQALLEGLDDPYSVSALAELREQHDALGQAANDIEREIRDYVQNSSALAVFATREEAVRALAGDESSPGIGKGTKAE
jgi:hypothetical protein